MSLTKEAKIGLLVTVSLLALFIGFYFLKGADLFSGEKTYYCFYDNVDGLQTSSLVKIRGLNVGRVANTQLMDNKGVRVAIALKKNIELPIGTKAVLASDNIISGTKMIRLDLGNGPGILESKSNLESSVDGGVLDNISVQLNPLIKDVRGMISSFDSVLVGISHMVGTQNQVAINSALTSLDSSMKDISVLAQTLKQENGDIKGILANVNSVTGNLASNNDNVQRILTNLSNTSDQLSKAPIQKTFDNLNVAVDNLQGIVNKINNSQGSLGELVNNKDLYNHLNTSLSTLNALMADINAHPSRYINVTIFGKKKDKDK